MLDVGWSFGSLGLPCPIWAVRILPDLRSPRDFPLAGFSYLWDRDAGRSGLNGNWTSRAHVDSTRWWFDTFSLCHRASSNLLGQHDRKRKRSHIRWRMVSDYKKEKSCKWEDTGSTLDPNTQVHFLFPSHFYNHCRSSLPTES